MAGKRWPILRRFNALSLWNKIDKYLALIGIAIGLIGITIGLYSVYLAYYPPINLTLEQIENLNESGANSEEVNNLLQMIQDERNKRIDEEEQQEFIEVISNIYKTIDSTAIITLNSITKDSLTGQKYRNDITIEKEVFGARLKFLFRLNPYNNITDALEILSFEKQMNIGGASKGTIISKGGFSKNAFVEGSKKHIGLARCSLP